MAKQRVQLYYVYTSPPKEDGKPYDSCQFGIYKDMYELVKTIYKRSETFIFHIFTNPKDGYWSPAYFGTINKQVCLLPESYMENKYIFPKFHKKHSKKSFISPFYKKNGIEIEDK